MNVFSALSVAKLLGLPFFAEKTVTGMSYLYMLELFVILQLQHDILFQQDGAPPR
jgi:hypothetical protein